MRCAINSRREFDENLHFPSAPQPFRLEISIGVSVRFQLNSLSHGTLIPSIRSATGGLHFPNSASLFLYCHSNFSPLSGFKYTNSQVQSNLSSCFLLKDRRNNTARGRDSRKHSSLRFHSTSSFLKRSLLFEIMRDSRSGSLSFMIRGAGNGRAPSLLT